MCCFLYFLDRRASLALDGLHANLVEPLHKQVAVFRVDNGLHRGSQNLYAVFLQYTVLVQFHATVQSRLSTKRQQNAVRPFFLDDALYELWRHRLEIHRVGHGLRGRAVRFVFLRGLYRSDIRINQYRVDAFFLQSFQCLRTAVVEFSGLTNLQGTRTQQQNFRYAVRFQSVACELLVRKERTLSPSRADCIQAVHELVEHPLRIRWT